MYVIQDKKTMRFLSWKSMPEGEAKNTYLYITYTGKLGTDFFKTIESAERDFNILQKRNEECKLEKLFCITEVDEDKLDELPVGETFIEHINLRYPEENKTYLYPILI